MLSLKPVDSVDVHMLVDNVTDNLSTVPSFVETEIAALARRRKRHMGVRRQLPLLRRPWPVLPRHDAHRFRQPDLLFDTGGEDRVFEQNVSRLAADLAPVESIVLSHGHWDHGGAMLRALQLIRDRNGGAAIPYYAHPDMFRRRATKRPDGSMRLMEDVPSIDALTTHGARVVNTKEPQLLLDGTAYVSGEIPRVTPFETGPARASIA